MKRIHTADPERAVHHERASIAVRLARKLKRALRPARLAIIAWQAQRSDEHLAALIDMEHSIQRALRRENIRRVEISAKRMAVQRGVA